MGCPGKFKCVLLQFDYFPWCKESRKTEHTLRICPRFDKIPKTSPTLSLSNMNSRDAIASKNIIIINPWIVTLILFDEEYASPCCTEIMYVGV